jgi:hypothetical protein
MAVWRDQTRSGDAVLVDTHILQKSLGQTREQLRRLPIKHSGLSKDLILDGSPVDGVRGLPFGRREMTGHSRGGDFALPISAGNANRSDLLFLGLF